MWSLEGTFNDLQWSCVFKFVIYTYTVEPLNKGPIRMSRYVPYLEVSFTGRLNKNCFIIIILILRFIAIPLKKLIV